VPAQLRQRAAQISATTEVLRSASSGRVFAQLEHGDAASAVRTAWLRELSSEGDGTFDRMRRELIQLNELYATALQKAGVLAEARRQGLLDDDALQPLQAVAGSSLEATMSAVDAINGMDPSALCLKQSTSDAVDAR
jgi:hypothetical protein